jgi:predicted RNA binding protein YcfA (HicA-like mRNA interferase family)
MNNLGPAIRDVLKKNGLVGFRTGKGDHESWRHAETGKRVTVEAKVKTRQTRQHNHEGRWPAQGLLRRLGAVVPLQCSSTLK